MSGSQGSLGKQLVDFLLINLHTTETLVHTQVSIDLYMGVYVSVHVWKTQDNLDESVLFPPTIRGPRGSNSSL